MRLKILQEMAANYEFTTEYTSTDNMLANPMTRASTGKTFSKHMDKLFRRNQQKVGGTADVAFLARVGGYLRKLRR